ncbi:MAG: hypothetical protein AAFX86_12605 [Pseudomonadota bacterium]
MSSEQNQPAHRPRINDYATILAVILSVVAIAVSLLEVSAMRAQQRASVWPYLSVSESFFQNRFSLTIENKGVDPALVKTVDWRVDGVPVNDLDRLILETVGEDLAFSYETYQVASADNDVLAVGEELTIFAVPVEPGTMAFLSAVRPRTSLEACYCSIHGDCWRVELRGGAAEPTQACD